MCKKSKAKRPDYRICLNDWKRQRAILEAVRRRLRRRAVLRDGFLHTLQAHRARVRFRLAAQGGDDVRMFQRRHGNHMPPASRLRGLVEPTR